ncbi:MAG: hypothetical protein M3247_07845 [Thermoproteota archaeon]|nr:hypothetical protein [Thermoproteota archaeon]
MPAKLPDAIKFSVIQQWLQGKSRNDIAAKNGLSTGAVTNIINEWSYNLGNEAADELRQLATTLRTFGITASQCALGFRAASIMLNIGVNQESFDSFIQDVYNRCKAIGLSPENIYSHMKDLVLFSTNGLPLSKIGDYLNEKTQEKRKLEEEIQRLGIQATELKQEEKSCEALRDKALREKEMTINEIKWYYNFKEELRKFSIQVDDIPEFARLIHNIHQHSGYDVEKVINEFWSLEMLRTNRAALQNDIDFLKRQIDELNNLRSVLESEVNTHNQAISAYNKLNDMGFGLKELDFVVNTVKEIAVENGLETREAVSKFLSDVQEQYNMKVGFEQKLQNMREEVNKLAKEQEKLRTELLLSPVLRPTLLRLIQSGLSEQDIINVADIIKKLSPVANNVLNTSNVDIQSLVSDLNKYRGIKSAIENLINNLDTLRKDTAFLVIQNQDLERDNMMIFSSSIHLSRTFDFMQGVVVSLRKEIMNLASIYMFIITHLLKQQSHDIGKVQSANQVNEFSALSRSKRGESVSFQEIKEDGIQAINVLLNSIGPHNDKLTTALVSARNALI